MARIRGTTRRGGWWLGPALLALALVGAACGGGDDDSGSGDGDVVVPGQKDPADPQPGGTLRFATEADASGGYCVPEAQLAAGGITVHNSIYDQLMIGDAEGTAQPYLAESVDVNEDATLYTITLREGVTFHDDTPLTAEVVKANMDIWRGDAATIAEYGRSPLLFPFVFSNLESVTVTGPMTLEVRMKTPWPAFPQYLASGRFGIAADAQLRSPNCEEELIGTGPFQLVSWTRNQEMVLEKNQNYWRTDEDGNQLPYLDELVFVPIEGGETRQQALEAGSVDAGQWSTQSVFDFIADSGDLNLVKEQPGRREVGYGLVNVANPPLDDREVREWMVKAVDRDALNDITNLGKFDLANQPFDSEVMGHVEDLDWPEYDPEGAAEYFAGKDISFRVSYATDPGTKALVEDLQRQLRDVGVEITVDEKDQATLINQALAGDFNLMLWRNHPGGDPDGQYIWWNSQSPVNFGRINDPELDRLLDEGRNSLDEATREQIYQDIARLFRDQLYNAWNWYTEWGIGAQQDVHQIGYYSLPDGSDGAGLNWGWTYWSDVWVEQ